MAHETEAVCLLRTGALYPKRLGLRSRETGENVLLASRTGSFSVYFDDAPLFHFDADGRWQRAFIDGIHYLKGLDGGVHSIDRVREGANLVLRRRFLTFSEIADLDASIRAAFLRLREKLDVGHYVTVEPPKPENAMSRGEVDRRIDGVADWDHAAWFRHRERYVSTYGVLPLPPPDCPNALMLQATLGHKDGRAFGLGRAEPYHERTIEEFASHVRDVRDLLGGRIDQCRHVFLAGADVLLLDPEKLTELFRIYRSFGPPESCMTFLDQFPDRAWDAGQFEELAGLGLTRVAIGIESGDRAVRERFGSNWTDESLRSAVGSIKRAGIDVSVMLLVGSGGADNAEADTVASPSLVEGLPLGAKDYVYLIDVREQLDSEVAGGAISDCDDAETERRTRAIKERLSSLRASKGIKIAPYTHAKQWS